MREEHKLNKAIKQDGVDTQSEILDELHSRYPQYVKRSDNHKAPARKNWRTVIYALTAVVACLAIIVPCAVLLPNANNGEDSNRYCTQGEYHRDEVQYTIGKYRSDNNLNFLYFDWYESGEDCITACYFSNSDNEVLCLEEQMYLLESDEIVRLSITKANIYLSTFDKVIDDCKGEYNVDNHTVNWIVDKYDAFCIFEDNGYRYFIQIKFGQDENRLFELVAELLETK